MSLQNPITPTWCHDPAAKVSPVQTIPQSRLPAAVAYLVASESTSLVKDSHLHIGCQLDLLELLHRDPMAQELHHAAGQ